MKILIALENIVMDGVKRASTVLGNSLNGHNGNEITFYSLSSDKSYYKLTAPLVTAKNPITSGILNYFGNNPYHDYKQQIKDLIDYLKENKIDVVILPGGLLASFSPFIKKEVQGIRVISWMHNNYDVYMTQYYKDMKNEFVEGLKCSDYVVTLTDYDLKNYSKINKNTLKIYNPITIHSNEYSDLSVPIISFTGRIAIQHKGIDYLLELAQSLPEGWKISIAGSGPEKDMNTFYNLIDELGVEDKIIYQGALKDEELNEHYKNSSIFVSTSRWEGMPLVIGEAMSYGLPIVAMDNSGSEEFIGDDKYGKIIEQGNVDELIIFIQKLIDDISLREYYSDKSITRINDFKTDRIIEEWEKLYK
ncbi:glycosyltransferase [Lactobacillus terrae]|uniref:glycosyltransferase n=1 Tax=Lactobacillus terrae TaxID=2269374 RepID=UPI000C1B6DC1|nr:glycosyltransferase [Lactobacillus terrae]